ncbi:MAG: hypothetical protein M0P57_06080 [Syntrophales bacterium]|jgi:hypothetical protein|nr:hypothetical protein [Syntrophales bacterium]MDY0045545.1 hypothetical protein [Syntrophales bacterium]
MKFRYVLLGALVFLTAGRSWADIPVFKSTASDQIMLEITIYNSNIGLVKDTRNVTLCKGEGELQFIDIASRILPVTVYVSSAEKSEDFRILEQNYNYDLINARVLLDKYIGKEIKILNWNKYQDTKEIVKATLLSNNEDQIFQIGGEIFLGYPGIRILPELPGNLIAQPALTWLFANESEKAKKLEVSYITENINWHADYIMMIEKEEASSELTGWITVDNRSGATYRKAKLKLIAGDIQRISEPQRDAVSRKELMLASTEPQFKEKSFFEYHMYDLSRPTTIENSQSKQIRLFETSGVKIEKDYRIYGSKEYLVRPYPGTSQKQNVEVHYCFRNSTENNLGIPLPAGIIRLYKKDGTGSRQFIGEDRIDHVPTDKKIDLKAGEAFDITAEKTQTEFEQISTRLFESKWRLTIENHKQKNINVRIIESMYGNWEIIESSHPYTKLDAFTIRFDVPVIRKGRELITYQIRTGM